MTSFGSNGKKEPGYNTTFRIQGQIYHRIGSLLPVDNNPSFLQIYFLGDNKSQVERRCTVVPKINKKNMLHEHNVLIKIFKNSLEKIPSEEHKIILIADKIPAGQYERRYNLPTSKEVAVIISGNKYNNRYIILEKCNQELITTSETHKSYDALQYPLMFWQGENGIILN